MKINYYFTDIVQSLSSYHTKVSHAKGLLPLATYVVVSLTFPTTSLTRTSDLAMASAVWFLVVQGSGSSGDVLLRVDECFTLFGRHGPLYA